MWCVSAGPQRGGELAVLGRSQNRQEQDES